MKTALCILLLMIGMAAVPRGFTNPTTVGTLVDDRIADRLVGGGCSKFEQVNCSNWTNCGTQEAETANSEKSAKCELIGTACNSNCSCFHGHKGCDG
jgi:hypothetical protein